VNYLDYIVSSQKFGELIGIPSICSAHPYVLEAELNLNSNHRHIVLIEATCNQVNQFGGYTKMKPADFRNHIYEVADRLGFPKQNILLGGDHLGPLVWARESAASAMAKAKEMVGLFVSNGFGKIHLDCSMPCADDHELSQIEIANRTAELAIVAEKAAADLALDHEHLPRYVIGSEVPTPGGSEAGKHELKVTKVESIAETLALTQKAFIARGLEAAWQRVIALVVQPGVEFGDEMVHVYNREKAGELAKYNETLHGMVYEAHSTDYQSRQSLRFLVEDHFAILKVGPALTFAFREAAFALAEIEEKIIETAPSHLRAVLESTMLENPAEWQKHYSGTNNQQKVALAFSFSDRIRYYWNYPAVKLAFERLMQNLSNQALPLSLVSQYFPRQYENIRNGTIQNDAKKILISHISEVLDHYQYACARI
jgi:D-tagatose-1,6-bisphosphate aldolase subunit GatZ/KbaZ